MIAERSAERTLKYGLVKLNVGLASVLLATGLTFAGGQAASADTVTTNTEAQTTEVAPGQNDATTEATEPSIAGTETAAVADTSSAAIRNEPESTAGRAAAAADTASAAAAISAGTDVKAATQQ